MLSRWYLLQFVVEGPSELLFSLDSEVDGDCRVANTFAILKVPPHSQSSGSYSPQLREGKSVSTSWRKRQPAAWSIYSLLFFSLLFSFFLLRVCVLGS